MNDQAFERDEDGQSHRIQVTQFPWDELEGERMEPDVKELIREGQLAMLGKFVFELATTNQGFIRPARSAAADVFALAYILGVRPDMTEEQWAAAAGISKQAFSKDHVLAWTDRLNGYKAPPQKTEVARKSYRTKKAKTDGKVNPRTWAGIRDLMRGAESVGFIVQNEESGGT